MAQDARDLHLADADPLADRGLREVLLEAQPHDLALARREGAHELVEHRALLGAVVAVVDVPDAVAERLARVVVAGRARRLERRGAVGARGLHRLEDVVGAHVDRVRHVVDRRLAAELARELRDDLVDAQGELLEVARDPDGPRPVAEVALDLAHDRRHGVAWLCAAVAPSMRERSSLISRDAAASTRLERSRSQASWTRCGRNCRVTRLSVTAAPVGSVTRARRVARSSSTRPPGRRWRRAAVRRCVVSTRGHGKRLAGERPRAWHPAVLDAPPRPTQARRANRAPRSTRRTRRATTGRRRRAREARARPSDAALRRDGRSAGA